MEKDAVAKIEKKGSIADFASSLTPKDVKLMKELFAMCDSDGDGELRRPELGQVMTDLGITHTLEDLDSLFKQLDTDNSGTVTFEEFLRGLRCVGA
jgi:Ca2+-binding EF-hand superfamily protein